MEQGFWYWFAQAMGIVITILCIVNPLFKKRWQMLIVVASINVLAVVNNIILNNFKIGSAVILCVVAVAQAIINYVHTSKNQESPLWEKILFTILYLGGGVFGLVNTVIAESEGNAVLIILRELLPIVGALFLMLSVFAPSEQSMRRYTLANASVWTVYYAIIGSTTVFAEIFAIVTACIALYKYRKKTIATEINKSNDELSGGEDATQSTPDNQ